VQHDPALVVGGPSTVQAAVPDLRVERGCRPLVGRAFRLNVVMRVEQEGRSACRSGNLSVDGGVIDAVGELDEPDAPYPAAWRIAAVASAEARTGAGS